MAKYKVGDKVRVITNGERNKCYYMEDRREHNTMVPKMLEFCGKVVTIKDVNAQYHIEECGYGWVDEMFEGLAEEEPTPTPVVNVNVTVNLYENACWYCRKGGLVDLYFNGSPGICPKCGRVMNLFTPTNMFNNNKREEAAKMPKENKPLTTEELKALPDGTRVFTVWLDERRKEPRPYDNRTCWRTVNHKKGGLDRKNGFVSFSYNDRLYYSHLEIPEGYVDNDP